MKLIAVAAMVLSTTAVAQIAIAESAACVGCCLRLRKEEAHCPKVQCDLHYALLPSSNWDALP